MAMYGLNSLSQARQGEKAQPNVVSKSKIEPQPESAQPQTQDDDALLAQDYLKLLKIH